ncbi:MAG TPA: S8 family serine peptidase [Enhygromyxa sp.]|nr:S8 family serine peptidase [Enhygromyxa sp.]
MRIGVGVGVVSLVVLVVGCGPEDPRVESSDTQLRAAVCLIPACADADLTHPERAPRQVYAKQPLRLPPERDALGQPLPWLMEVKFIDAARVRVRADGLISSEAEANLAPLRARLKLDDLSLRPGIEVDPARLAALEQRAAARTGRAQPDLAGVARVEIDAPRSEWKAIGERLQALELVELVSITAARTPPPGDIEPLTPDLTDSLVHFGPNPGVDVAYGWSEGLTGAGVRLADVELSWNTAHEDLVDGTITAEAGQTPDAYSLEYIDHGTAVIGITSAVANAYGITGSSHESELFLYPELTVEGGARRYQAILAATMGSTVGDVVMLEIQTEGIAGPDSFVPGEYAPLVHMATQVATDAGVIVIAAAGNGAQDLDAAAYQDYLDYGDSGALIVGAGSPDLGHDRLSFSTYGSRVNVQGWGSDVFTLGYGNFATYGGDPQQTYVAGFNGTSSATPIVASVVVLLQERARQLGVELTAFPLRDLLVSSGIPQGSGGHIGPLPNLPAALAFLEGDDLAPPVVELTSPGPGPELWIPEDSFVTTIEIVASDESPISAVHLDIAGQTQPWVGLTPPYRIEDVSFPVGDWTVQARATDLWGHEGWSEILVVHVGQEMPMETETETETDTSSDSESDGATESDEGDGESGSAAADEDDDGGCSIAGVDSGRAPVGMLGLLTLIGWRRARRRLGVRSRRS